MTKRLLNWLKWLVPVVAAFFIGRIIYRQWQQVRNFDWHFDPLYLLLSFLATSSWFFVRSYIWRFLVARFGYTIPYRECIRIWVLSELSRYVPGTVWQYFSRIYLAGRWGVPSTVALTSALMELLLMALAAIPLVLWHLDDILPVVGSAQRVLLFTFPFAAALLLHPAVLNRLARLFLPRLKLVYVPIQLRFREILALWAACLVLWILFGTGFLFFVRSLAPLDLYRGVPLVSNYAASWLIGVVTLFAPGGIGVREGVLGLLLSKILPLGTALLVAVLSRLWLISLEIFWAAIAQFLFHLPPPGDSTEPRGGSTRCSPPAAGSFFEGVAMVRRASARLQPRFRRVVFQPYGLAYNRGPSVHFPLCK